MAVGPCSTSYVHGNFLSLDSTANASFFDTSFAEVTSNGPVDSESHLHPPLPHPLPPPPQRHLRHFLSERGEEEDAEDEGKTPIIKKDTRISIHLSENATGYTQKVKYTEGQIK